MWKATAPKKSVNMVVIIRFDVFYQAVCERIIAEFINSGTERILLLFCRVIIEHARGPSRRGSGGGRDSGRDRDSGYGFRRRPSWIDK